jgi:hypothetical protein
MFGGLFHVDCAVILETGMGDVPRARVWWVLVAGMMRLGTAVFFTPPRALLEATPVLYTSRSHQP